MNKWRAAILVVSMKIRILQTLGLLTLAALSMSYGSSTLTIHGGNAYPLNAGGGSVTFTASGGQVATPEFPCCDEEGNTLAWDADPMIYTWTGHRISAAGVFDTTVLGESQVTLAAGIVYWCAGPVGEGFELVADPYKPTISVRIFELKFEHSEHTVLWRVDDEINLAGMLTEHSILEDLEWSITPGGAISSEGVVVISGSVMRGRSYEVNVKHEPSGLEDTIVVHIAHYYVDGLKDKYCDGESMNLTATVKPQGADLGAIPSIEDIAIIAKPNMASAPNDSLMSVGNVVTATSEISATYQAGSQQFESPPLYWYIFSSEYVADPTDDSDCIYTNASYKIDLRIPGQEEDYNLNPSVTVVTRFMDHQHGFCIQGSAEPQSIFTGQPTPQVIYHGYDAYEGRFMGSGTLARHVVATTNYYNTLPTSQFYNQMVAEELRHVAQLQGDDGITMLNHLFKVENFMLFLEGEYPESKKDTLQPKRVYGQSHSDVLEDLSLYLTDWIREFILLEGELYAAGTDLRCSMEIDAKNHAGAEFIGRLKCTYKDCL